ncbi:hypothetical protein J2X90_000170 [Variovorax paradoxus]|jgi:hypothetical protein|uniref:hypothetical protein n=1 Tax=Variovorax paradoxus TaxID=34073 RepID=UPI00277EF371|nr:hypothetical protein [Variovorax paradoxus]MDP9932947.1 hypothetical protein [Variovorax paradoxus]MDQ0022392.1 hypothetical protein [Variovorax paradoxus]
MTTTVRSSLFAAALFAASSFLLLPGASIAQAQAPEPGSAARAQQERATCDGVQQDRAACLREAGAARQEAARNGLTSVGPGRADANAMARCREQPAADRADCEARLQGGARTSTEGSVMGGGIIRETVTPLPPQPVTPTR